MSNIIRIDNTTPTEDWLCMSNGTMDVFIDLLTLSGSALAKTEQEKLLTVWLAEKDQAVVGSGTVGFDLCEMPWTAEGFVQERDFLCRIIDAAIEECGWEQLNYPPDKAIMLPFLERFRSLLLQMTAAQIALHHRTEWLHAARTDDPIRCGFPYCPKHGVLLTFGGCKLCHNESEKRP